MNFVARILCAVFDCPMVLGVFLLTFSDPANAEDWSDGRLMRALERPGHEALMTLIARPTSSLAPFETDGCSGGLSDAWHVAARQFPDFAEAHQASPPWESCCVAHDQVYHDAGGNLDARASFNGRLKADQVLRSCVRATGAERVDALVQGYQVSPAQIETAYAAIAEAMFVAVRLGGGPCSGLPWRWGYGYSSCSVFTGVFD